MSSRILGADRGLEWHQAVAPVWEVGEIATHGLALSRLKHGFEFPLGPPITHGDHGSRDQVQLEAKS